MKRSEIYTKAAELIDSGNTEFSCCAVDCAQLDGKSWFEHYTPARRAYAEFMLGLNPATAAGGMEGRYSCPEVAELFDMYDSGKVREARELRVLLLLMMAAVAGD